MSVSSLIIKPSPQIIIPRRGSPVIAPSSDYYHPTLSHRGQSLLPDHELLSIYPGFTIEQIKAGLYTPATLENCRIDAGRR